MIVTKPSREINPHFEKIGRRTRLTGYIATLTDGVDVLFSREYSNYHDAEVALDQAMYDLLTTEVETISPLTRWRQQGAAEADRIAKQTRTD